MVPNQLTILLVDDNDDDILIVREAVSEIDGVEVAVAVHHGDEALRFLRREEPFQDARLPDLVLLDINMPKKNGFEYLADIKADPALRHIPVIMYTSSGREEDILHAYSLGACSYIVKPVEFGDLVSIVRHLASYWTRVSRLPQAWKPEPLSPYVKK